MIIVYGDTLREIQHKLHLKMNPEPAERKKDYIAEVYTKGLGFEINPDELTIYIPKAFQNRNIFIRNLKDNSNETD